MEELLKNLEKYRIAENYKASNIIFPIKYKGEKYIVKKPRKLSSIINTYYAFQGKFFYKDRKLSSGTKAIQQEIKKLSQLQGFSAPKLEAYTDRLLVKEFIEGTSLRDCNCVYTHISFLEQALVAMEEIHNVDVVIGDTNVKNVIKGNKGFYWIDFDGVFDETDLVKSKALDVLKMVYSTYLFTKNKIITEYAAVTIRNYENKEVKTKILELVNPGLSNLSAWFSTRVNKKLNQNIKDILKMVC
ncbi:MAG: hypothetical protein KKB39_00395 [Nanoarchaeota archaeon]|nr:hypothetical protein [Nanoarchaeota archaeon]